MAELLNPPLPIRNRRETALLRRQARREIETWEKLNIPSGLESLKLNSTLSHLPMFDATVEISATTETVRQLLSRRPEIPGVIVSEGGRFANLICRRAFFELLGRPFGVDLFLNRPVREVLDMLPTPPVVMPSFQQIREAARVTLGRPQEAFYDPIVVACADGRHRILDSHILLMAQSVLLSLSQREIRRQLADATGYVLSLLPAPLVDGPVRAHWRYVPSDQLGGDAFGYHWLDEEHFGLYLLDVAGHGTGPALLSVSAMHVLREKSLPGIDFRQPLAVVRALNEMFLSLKHGGLFFTLWYGVYNVRTRGLEYTSAGHPPAFAVSPGETQARALRQPGLPIGTLAKSTHLLGREVLAPRSRLYLFSDGCYEVVGRETQKILSLNDFEAVLTESPRGGEAEPERIEREMLARSRDGKFADDFTLVVFDFPE